MITIMEMIIINRRTTMYCIRRLKDKRLIAGLFVAIETEDFAKRLLKQWQYNCPDDEFYIECRNEENEQ
jgi:hypothetical protein